MATIDPGTAADIVFEGSESSSNAPTIIYDVVDQRVILSQTMPPIMNDRIGKRLLVTFLEKNEKGDSRYGFWAKLTGLVADYEIAAAQRVPVLVLQIQTDPKPHNFRMSYRIKPLPNKGLAGFFEGEEVTIVDISVGGIRISTGTNRSLNPHDILTVTVAVDDKKFDIEGEVIKVSPSSMPGNKPGHRQVAIRFISHQKEREAVLGEKIFRMDRERIAQGMR